jgi:hypothetical protein
MYSEEKIKILLHDLETAYTFYKHKHFESDIELKAKIEILRWILEKY